MKISSLTISALQNGYRKGDFTPVDTVREIFCRIRAYQHNPIWIQILSEDQVIEQAKSLQEDRSLFGIPFAIKDNIDVAGIPTTAGCPAFSYVPNETAAVVQKLLEAGAILIGKTNLDQFATGLVGTRSPYGACHSVFSDQFISGGSSSGSAVAVASGLVSFALGTDTAGSGRVPAALNNIVGLKPTIGILSTGGIIPACRSLDCVSVFALTVGDAEKVLINALTEKPLSRWERNCRNCLNRSARIGTLTDLQAIDEQFRPAYEQAIQRLLKMGHTIVETDIGPFLETAKLLYDGPWLAERFAAVGAFIKEHPDKTHPVVRDIILSGEQFSAAEAFKGQYRLKRLKELTALTWDFIDFLCLPTVPGTYRISQVFEDPVLLNSRLGRFTNFLNLLDLAAVAVPAAHVDKLPFGISFIGPAYADIGLLKISKDFLQSLRPMLGGTQTVYPEAEESLWRPTDKTCIGVVGAHLSGLALNHQLTSRAARHVRTTVTAPCYRLFAMRGTNPSKPGLVRTREGSTIEIEIWELSYEAFGSFVAEVPSPLTIGTILLADGESVKGFLCEAIALDGAQDISEFGGWRKFLESSGSLLQC
ncbi:MAG: allophanate hydrolase [Verrucomicrobia bacterium]|nr:allophanate hydrolase [Verrucomicrobiota bacterium]